jgi:hypothetical protein
VCNSSLEAHLGLFFLKLKDHFHVLYMVSWSVLLFNSSSCAVNVGGLECTGEPGGKAYFVR